MRARGRRPYDWTPLAERDPVPGDPAALRDEVTHMRRLASTLRDQARELKAIGAEDGLKGQYADALRGGARELECHLRQTAERYEHVQGHLASWADELEDFQSESATILRRAQDTAAPRRSGDDDALKPYRDALTRLTALRDERASHYAGRIKRACKDVIKDSPWESFEDAADAVFDNEWSQKFFELASWVVTVVGVVALFVTPAGWVVDLALGITFALAAKDVLALAVGEGSWFDIGMDTLGFLTMGTGKVAFGMLKGIQTATGAAAEAVAEERAAAESLHESRGVLDRTYRITNRRGSSGAAKAEARRVRAGALARARQAGLAARQAERSRELLEATPREAFAFGGDREAASACKNITRLREEYAQSPEVQKASAHMEGWRSTFNAGWRVGMASDGIDKTLGHSDALPMKPSFGPYDDFKDQFTSTVGTGW
ncbi:hypothetical protein K7472_08505 [Streptomyces sp. PTM05]|uniref:Uncharacterized protein n=1 Tax=Streptantibioticus parmotrematis TaxID=2873249 RepID=A0ABS7QNY4_9ACTN|nr:hypothetical protein [Streptantibioticus parmotrematis]MBY8884888.1 hypothetical protein [Streptantibioticus parmotrematis]